jgi:hypothetical protein
MIKDVIIHCSESRLGTPLQNKGAPPPRGASVEAVKRDLNERIGLLSLAEVTCPASNARQARRADESLLAERNPTKVSDADRI